MANANINIDYLSSIRSDPNLPAININPMILRASHQLNGSYLFEFDCPNRGKIAQQQKIIFVCLSCSMQKKKYKVPLFTLLGFVLFLHIIGIISHCPLLWMLSVFFFFIRRVFLVFPIIKVFLCCFIVAFRSSHWFSALFAKSLSLFLFFPSTFSLYIISLFINVCVCFCIAMRCWLFWRIYVTFCHFHLMSVTYTINVIIASSHFFCSFVFYIGQKPHFRCFLWCCIFFFLILIDISPIICAVIFCFCVRILFALKTGRNCVALYFCFLCVLLSYSKRKQN